jgi:hypothetical protein
MPFQVQDPRSQVLSREMHGKMKSARRASDGALGTGLARWRCGLVWRTRLSTDHGVINQDYSSTDSPLGSSPVFFST